MTRLPIKTRKKLERRHRRLCVAQEAGNGSDPTHKGGKGTGIDISLSFLRREALHYGLKELILGRKKRFIGFHLFASSLQKKNYKAIMTHKNTRSAIMIGFKSVIPVMVLLAITIVYSQQVDLLKSGVENWNKWRDKNTTIIPDLRKARLDSADLRRAHLEKADLWEARLRRARLDSADLSNVNLDSADLLGADLRGADLPGAQLRSADLQAANLAKTVLYSADFYRANLQGAQLDSANLEGVDLQRANLQGANLQGADLQGANLREARLRGARLQSADLRRADLQRADLRGALLQGTQLDSAILKEADLRGADLSKTNLIEVLSFYKVKLDPDILSEIKAKWPEKLATIYVSTTGKWFVDETILEYIKLPDWHGWPEEKEKGK
jgi:uncharacterized protein YjbI with pentapeptide repeats